MANRKTQKKREREALKKAKRQSFFDYYYSNQDTSSKIKMEGDDSDGNRTTQYRVPGGASIPSGEFAGEH